jgi:hypothetical protein
MSGCTKNEGTAEVAPVELGQHRNTTTEPQESPEMSRPTARSRKIASYAAIPAALLASGLIVSQASYSAYSATTTNPASNWNSGTVALTDGDNSIAAFTATNLKPGATDAKCITVTSAGTLASAVKLYGTNPATTNNLAAHIDLTITQGTGGLPGGSCTNFVADAGNPGYTGTLAGFGSTATNYDTGIGTWAPTGTGSETRTYKINYTLSSTAPNTTQGGTATIGFTWEAQNS